MAGLISSSWQNMAATPELSPGSVHLWRIPLNDDKPLSNILSNDEKLRQKRLRVPDKARAFAVGRTRLRQILGFYLDASPEELTFVYNQHGKPSLAGKFSTVAFNLSHSGNWGLCAVSQGGDVGVDLEAMKKDLAVGSLAERFFTQAESGWLASLDPVRQRRSFYRLWTRKEAWLKGKGSGFSELNLGLADAHITGCLSKADGWLLMNLPVAKGYVGALAVKGEVERVERFSIVDKL